AVCRVGRGHFPQDIELLFQEGVLLDRLGDDVGAELCWLRILAGKEADHFASVDTGLAGYKTRHNLAVLYLKQKRLAEAVGQWQSAVGEQPDFLPAQLGLGDAYLALGRFPELQGLIRELEQNPATNRDGLLFRARIHLALKEFQAARDLLEPMIKEAPR